MELPMDLDYYFLNALQMCDGRWVSEGKGCALRTDVTNHMYSRSLLGKASTTYTEKLSLSIVWWTHKQQSRNSIKASHFLLNCKGILKVFMESASFLPLLILENIKKKVCIHTHKIIWNTYALRHHLVYFMLLLICLWFHLLAALLAFTTNLSFWIPELY